MTPTQIVNSLYQFSKHVIRDRVKNKLTRKITKLMIFGPPEYRELMMIQTLLSEAHRGGSEWIKLSKTSAKLTLGVLQPLHATQQFYLPLKE